MKKIFLMLLLVGTLATSTMLTCNAQEVENNKSSQINLSHEAENMQYEDIYVEDNYVPQEMLSEEEYNYYQDLVDMGECPEEFIDIDANENNSNKIQIYSISDVYGDHEPNDGHENQANKIDTSGTIEAVLDLKSGWQQFWSGIGERDEDYYRFTLREKLTMTFNFTGPNNYYFRLLRYAKNSEYITNTYSNRVLSIELEPATYYIHVYANDKNDIKVDEKYRIIFSGRRTSNLHSLYLSEETKAEYGMAVWENEIWPKNSTRWTANETTLKHRTKPRRGQAANTGYVDPLFYSNESSEILTDEIFLDSIMYVWGKDILTEISLKLDEITNAVREAIYNKKIKEIKAEIREERIGNTVSVFLDIIGFFDPTLTTPIITVALDGSNFLVSFFKGFICDLDFKEATQEFNAGFWLGSLSQACYDYSRLDGAVLRLAKYYKFELVKGYIGNSTLKTYDWKRVTVYAPFGVDDHSVFLHEGDYISCNQYEKETGIMYHGNLVAFKSSTEFSSYIEGNGGGNSLSNHQTHEFSSINQYDANNHKLSCLCGYNTLMKHNFIYNGSNLICEDCEYQTNPVENTILKNSYGFDSVYNLTQQNKYISLSNNETVLTKRLRCGIVNGYLAMSAKSNDADKAYLEYHFNKEVVEINYEFGLWSDDESLIKNSSIRLEVLYDSKWVTVKTFDAKTMSTDKDQLNLYITTLDVPTSAFRFIVETNKVSNNNNRGRVVIGNIDVKQIP